MHLDVFLELWLVVKIIANPHLPPINIITTENTFSHFVFADTFPNPTVVSDVHE